MAGLKKFVVPSLEEMESANQENPPEALFTKVKESSVKSTEGTSAPKVNKDIKKATNSIESTEPTIEKQTAQPSTIQNENTSETNTTNQTSTESQETAGSTITAKPTFSNSLIVNTRQRGNPILKSVRNITWEYGNIIPDYVMGQSNCALFLSLRYHQLHPNYIHERLKQLGKSYELRVMLVLVDVKESHHLLKDLAKICLLADCTLVLAFSPEEAGRYLETYKIFENKPPEAIMEKTEDNFIAKFTDCLTRVKSVNKTDCLTLITHFQTLANVMDSSEEDLSLCPGFGPQKAKRLHSVFHEPFVKPSHSGTHTS